MWYRFDWVCTSMWQSGGGWEEERKGVYGQVLEEEMWG